MTEINLANIGAIIQYFTDGIKQTTNQKLGVEVEHFICTNDNNTVSFHGKHGVEELLQELSHLYNDKSYSDGHLVGLSRPHCTISIEPSAQLEASIGEFYEVEDLVFEYEKFFLEVNNVLVKWNQKIVTEGYNPYNSVSELELIPKQRYKIMNEHFLSCGGLGVNMMRASCATQISIDFVDEADYCYKYRLANILSPIFNYMYDNTSIFEKNKAGRLTKFKIWNELEGADKHGNSKSNRTGFVASCFRSTFRDYAEYIMTIKPLFIYNNNEEIIFTKDKTVEQVFANRLMQQKDIEHVLSMVFPFVRLKKYIEIRMADSLPIDKLREYLAIIKGVFYNAGNLHMLLDVTRDVDFVSAMNAWKDLTHKQDQAMVYGKNIKDWILLLKSLA